MKRKVIAGVAGVLLATSAFAGVAGANSGKAYGKTITGCLGYTYGQALNIARTDPAHEGLFPPASGAKAVAELALAGGHPCPAA